MMIGVLTLARLQSAVLSCVPVLTVTVGAARAARGVAPEADRRARGRARRRRAVHRDGVSAGRLRSAAVGVRRRRRAGGSRELTVCVREVPEVPQPLQDQVPPEEGSGAKVTCAPELIVALAVCVPLMTAVMVVAGQRRRARHRDRVNLSRDRAAAIGVAAQSPSTRQSGIRSACGTCRRCRSRTMTSYRPRSASERRLPKRRKQPLRWQDDAPLMTGPMVVAGQVGGVTTAP